MITLTKDQKETLLDYMDRRLKGLITECGFCTVAEQMPWGNNEDEIELYEFCCNCPLSVSRNDGQSCLETRHSQLRDSEGSHIGLYEDATKKSIENRVDYLIDMVNKHTDAKFGWLRTIKGEDKVIDYELKRKGKKDEQRIS